MLDQADTVWALSTEMRSKVVSPAYHLRRVLDSVLSHVLPPPARKEILLPQGPAVQSKSTPPPSTTEPFPTARVNGWSSLYTMVTFRPDVSYQEALRKEKAQRDIVQGLAWGLGGGVGLAAMGGLVWGALYGQKYLQSIR
jgi:kynurenine 3-monooxygenase